MLDSMTVSSNDNEARIFFGDPAQEVKAVMHQEGTKHLPARPFFGVSLGDREEIVSDIRQSLFRRINKI
jgi:phage gpG-like protein